MFDCLVCLGLKRDLLRLLQRRVVKVYLIHLFSVKCFINTLNFEALNF